MLATLNEGSLKNLTEANVKLLTRFRLELKVL